jgi:hypothetical protein
MEEPQNPMLSYRNTEDENPQVLVVFCDYHREDIIRDGDCPCFEEGKNNLILKGDAK